MYHVPFQDENKTGNLLGSTAEFGMTSVHMCMHNHLKTACKKTACY